MRDTNQGWNASEQQLVQTKEDEYISYSRLIYRYCKKYYPGIIQIAKLIRRRAKNEYDNQVAVEGETGSGKSMFTFILCNILQFMNRRKFNIKKQILFIPDEMEMSRNIGRLLQDDIYWIDEAIRGLDKKRWQNADQIELNHIIKTERWKRNTIIYCMPRFAEFTESFRNGNIFFRVYIVPQYAAVLFAKDIDKDVEDPWHTKHNLSIKYKNYRGQTRYSALLDPETRLNKERRLPNYLIDTQFPNLEKVEHLKHEWFEYQRLKEESRANLREQNERKKSKAKNIKEYKYKLNLIKLSMILMEKDKLTPKEYIKKYELELSETTLAHAIDDYLHNNVEDGTTWTSYIKGLKSETKQL